MKYNINILYDKFRSSGLSHGQCGEATDIVEEWLKNMNEPGKKELKLFEIKEYTDGGPNDQGHFHSYYEAESEEAARKETRFTTGHYVFIEISREAYERRRDQELEMLHRKYNLNYYKK